MTRRDTGRYSRQIAFHKIGLSGQEKILSAKAVIIGAGALGTVIANNLCRAGLGFLRIIDRDSVELSNLQRQALFDEEDVSAKVSKAEGACGHLARINSNVKLEPVAASLDSSNIEEFIQDADVVLDGTDNMEARFLMNEACHKHRIPWVHGGVLGSAGNSMTILPGEGPCFRCFVPEIPAAGTFPTCVSSGVLNMITGIIASLESAEALKIITGSPDINRRLFIFDVWKNTAEYLDIAKNPDCPVCGYSRYEILDRPAVLP